MFRRSSKLTAVLVAAASIASTAVPAVQVVAAERLGTKEGNITTARAFEGGYIYDGYKTDDDDAALYYNKGDKDQDIDKDEDYDGYSLERYGEKYIKVQDNNDDYLVDITTGKIDSDENVSDKEENAQNKLKTKINKEDRYKADSNKGSIKTFEKVLDNKYGEVWYKFSATGDSSLKDRVTTDTAAYIGFSDNSGKYVDVCQDANMYVYDKAQQKTIKVEEYGKSYGKNDTSVQLQDVKVLAQDKDNLYTLTTVVVNNTDKQYFFQKISKAQGSDKDGGKLPKSTASYQLDNKSIYDDGDMETAYKLLVEGKDGDYKAVNYTVDGGYIYVTTVTEGTSEKAKVKMYKLKFKKDKIDGVDGKENIDTYIVKKDDDGDHDTVSREKIKDTDVVDVYSIDKDGNTWILDKGKILKVDGTDFKEVYTCDRSLDRLDVYDENNLIAWCSDGDVYTTVSEGKKQAATDAGNTTDEKDSTKTTTEAQVGWVKNADSTWSYYKNGAKATGWYQDGASWYYLDAAGIMKTGWQQVGGVWYYLNPNSDGYQGVMKTGWINDNGTWYYCNASGAMLSSQWFQDSDGKWYYLQASGAMAVNTTIGGYVIGSNGAWVK